MAGYFPGGLGAEERWGGGGGGAVLTGFSMAATRSSHTGTVSFRRWLG